MSRTLSANSPPASSDRLSDLAGAVVLTREQIDRFNDEGFLAIDRITTPNEVAWMTESYDQLFAEKPGWNRGDFFDFAGPDDADKEARLPQLLNPSRYDARLAETAFRKNAEAIAQQLLGQRAKLIFEHAIMKPALTGGETAWHQDEAFHAKYTNYRSLTVWMPLQPVTIENGCMEFIPGSHKAPIVRHRHVSDDPRIHGLEAIDVDASAAVVCPLPAGGATIHSDRTLHHAGPNLSSAPRRAYALVFGVTDRKYILREDFPWNVGRTTAREQRLAHSRGPAGRLVAAMKGWTKAILRR